MNMIEQIATRVNDILRTGASKEKAARKAQRKQQS